MIEDWNGHQYQANRKYIQNTVYLLQEEESKLDVISWKQKIRSNFDCSFYIIQLLR